MFVCVCVSICQPARPVKLSNQSKTDIWLFLSVDTAILLLLLLLLLIFLFKTIKHAGMTLINYPVCSSNKGFLSTFMNRTVWAAFLVSPFRNCFCDIFLFIVRSNSETKYQPRVRAGRQQRLFQQVPKNDRWKCSSEKKTDQIAYYDSYFR